MTTIAWDGKTLAADRRVVRGSVRVGTTGKLLRLSDGRLTAFSGLLCHREGFLEYAEGRRACPPSGEYTAIIVELDGRVFRYEEGLGRIQENGPGGIAAAGSGLEFALAAMLCGRSAAEAVAVAAQLDIYTGDGVDELDLNP